MDLWLAAFNAPEPGTYKFKMDQRDDYVTIWLDLDQNGIRNSDPCSDCIVSNVFFINRI